MIRVKGQRLRVHAKNSSSTLIGITFSGRELAIAVAVIVIVAVGAWYFLRRRR